MLRVKFTWKMFLSFRKYWDSQHELLDKSILQKAKGFKNFSV